MVYYIPLWLQAIKSKSAVQSGIDTIPMVLSLVVGAIGAGQIVGRMAYHTSFAMASSVIMPIGAGLISTFDLNTGSGKWIGYQILFGLGMGMGMQQGTMAAQTVLHRKDVRRAYHFASSASSLVEPSLCPSGKMRFIQKFTTGLTTLVHDLDVGEVVNTGATEIAKIVPEKDLHEVLVAYNDALRQVFVVGVVMACLPVIGAFSLEWRSVQGRQGPTEKGSNNDSKIDTTVSEQEKA
ncbi:MFS-type efflux pump MFS1 [Fulvia fulva]|nr:MFS-type efflux pump MFS1 [Fulvia fulva]WPV14619.1 MFS-type efflux pump MFS1 [Fulvia fulva]WPV29386.1 MFS-type efflux pump MFS1 [Fulvia fulva]